MSVGPQDRRYGPPMVVLSRPSSASAVAWPRATTRSMLPLALVLFSALVVGCGGEPDAPAATGSPTDPSSPTATPTSTPALRPSPSPSPSRPEVMERNDVEGAIAAAQYFLELYPYAYNTGDLEDWRAMSHPECVFCIGVIRNVEDLHSIGGYELGGEFIFRQVSAREPLSGNEYFAVDFDLEQKPGIRVDGDGSRQDFDGDDNLTVKFALGAINDQWVIREVTVEDRS
jgi:hypothetical protein